MIAVVDVSGIMQVLLKTTRMEHFNKVLQQASLVLTPDLYVAELSNVLWKYYTQGILSADICCASIQDGLSYVDRFVSSRELWREAFAEAVCHNHSVYDMLYLVLARRNYGTIITYDQALTKICHKAQVKVIC